MDNIVHSSENAVQAEGNLVHFPVCVPEAQAPTEANLPLPSVVPYGFLRCTCEEHPHLTYINDKLLEALGFSQTHRSWKEVLKEDIFVIIPTEERERFQLYLDEARRTRRPVNIEHTLLRNGGDRLPLMGWINVQKSADGTEEYALLYMRLEYKHTENQTDLESSYVTALKKAYDIIFELNLPGSTVECIHGRETSSIGAIADIQMTLDSAKNFWLNNFIDPEDKPMMTAYLDRITSYPPNWDGRRALQAEFRINWADGKHRFIVVAVQMDGSRVILCCRDISHLEFAGSQMRESITFEKMRYWMDIFTTIDPKRLGMLIFEQAENSRPLLYASPPIRRYMSQGQDILPPTLDLSQVSPEEFETFLQTRQLSFTLPEDDRDRHFRLTCKRYSPQEGNSLYLVWVYEKQATQPPELREEKRIFARTFGHFDLFVDDVPVTFSSPKEKELMALLIDRNGGTLSTTEAVSYLWEDEAADERVSNRYRKLVMGLKRTLESYGIEHILISQKGIRSMDVNALQCDYYEYLAGNPQYKKTFHNAYMTDYSWSEETLARLWIDSESGDNSSS